MKPKVTMHMMSSIDGRIVPTDWPGSTAIGDIYEEVHRDLKGDAWIVGRVTMAEFSQGEPRPAKADMAYPRETWKAPAAAKGPFAIALDRHGNLHLNRDRANGDALIAVLTEAVSDDHLAELRRDGISYIFAGKNDIDLEMLLDILSDQFGISSLLLEGGGGINGLFLAAGLIDEISLLLVPIADGAAGAPTLIDRTGGSPRALSLKSTTSLRDGVVHLVYGLG